MKPPPTELHCLVSAAREGEQDAWRQLVVTYSPLLMRVARSHRLRRDDAEDVVQLTWLRLLRSIRTLEDPGAVRAWLVTTARREALRRLQSDRRELPFGDLSIVERPDATSAEDELVRRERRGALRVAIQRLPLRQRAVLDALLAEPAPSYERIAKQLRMPVGSIGPTRARSLERLRRDAGLVLAAS